VQAELGRHFAYWRGALGLLVMLLMVLAPSGLGGLWVRWQQRRQVTALPMLHKV
jgi:branched-chain amino acid transport system permease protein